MGAHAKQAGERMAGREVELFVDQKGPEEMQPYERLIGDAISGDNTLFAREDEVEAAWTAVDPVLSAPIPVYEYEPGTWGPSKAFDIIQGDCGWHDPGATADGWTRWPMRT
jgi:glucose-6-phosphate 1-dehydrogenase